MDTTVDHFCCRNESVIIDQLGQSKRHQFLKVVWTCRSRAHWRLSPRRALSAWSALSWRDWIHSVGFYSSGESVSFFFFKLNEPHLLFHRRWISVFSFWEAVQMLAWIGAVCVLLLVAMVWPVLKHLVAFLTGPEIAPRGERSASASATGTEPVKVHKPAGDSSAPVAFICKPSALAKYLLKHCTSFCKYVPNPAWHWRASPCLQTVLGALWPHDCAVHFIRDYLQLSDDGLVALDWAVVGPKRRTSSNSSSPILLIIPNSFGKLTRNVLKVIKKKKKIHHFSVLFVPNQYQVSSLCMRRVIS